MSSERNVAELTRFGLGFLGFLLAIAGVVLVTPGLAITGTVLLLIVVSSFTRSDSD